MRNESVNVVRTAPSLRRTSLGNAARVEGTTTNRLVPQYWTCLATSCKPSQAVKSGAKPGTMGSTGSRNAVVTLVKHRGLETRLKPPESLQHEHGVSH